MHHFARLFSTLTTLVGSWVVVLLNTKLTTVSTKLVLSKWAETMTNSDPPLGIEKDEKLRRFMPTFASSLSVIKNGKIMTK